MHPSSCLCGELKGSFSFTTSPSLGATSPVYFSPAPLLRVVVPAPGAMTFDLADIPENADGWGPTEVPAHLKGIPFAPFEKRSFMGRMADWSARAEQYRERMRNRPGKEAQNEAFTAAADDTEGFSLVDTKSAPQQPQWDKANAS